jgi:hypothetical protein
MPWRHRVESLALELRARLTAHPGAVGLMIGGPMGGPHALALNERLLELLADGGLTHTEAARAAYLLIVYVFGAIGLEVAAHDQPAPLPSEAERIAARHLAYAATPAEHYPRTAAAVPTLVATSPLSSTSGGCTDCSTASPPHDRQSARSHPTGCGCGVAVGRVGGSGVGEAIRCRSSSDW